MFNEELKDKTNSKVNGYTVCFLYNIFFMCYFCSQSLYCFNQSLYCFLPEKVGCSEKNWLLNGVEKWSRRQRHRCCSKWPLSAWTHALSLVPIGQSHHLPWSAGTHAMSEPAAVTARPRHGLESCILAPASCSRCGSPPGSEQCCWLATCQDWWSLGSRGTEVWPSDEHGV